MPERDASERIADLDSNQSQIMVQLSQLTVSGVRVSCGLACNQK